MPSEPPTFQARVSYEATASGTPGTLPQALVLAGAAVGLAQSLLMLVLMTLELTMFHALAKDVGDNFSPMRWVAFFPIVMGGLALVALVGAILAFRARARLVGSRGREGGGLAVAAGVVMLVGMGMIGGVLSLIGGILAGNPARASST